MSIKYVEGAGPCHGKGESKELFYRVHEVEEIFNRLDAETETPEDSKLTRDVYDWIVNTEFPLDSSFSEVVSKALKHIKGKHLPSKRSLLKQLRRDPPHNEGKLAWFSKALVTKKVRSESGVLVVTVLTSPFPSLDTDPQSEKTPFSCAFDCFFCPNEPGQPRSYLRDEPAVLRANQNGFDPLLQFTDRCATLFENGHSIDKVELLILGGTWSSYAMNYREVFVRDLFFAANTFLRPSRPKRTLEEELKENESTTCCRIIGLTVETRPDCIDAKELVHFRRIGCTRVQLGVQHTNNALLKKVNRGHTIEHAMQAIALLKQQGFKVDAHLMPNLPESTPALDAEMLHRMCTDPRLSVDQIKVYPMEIVPFTRVEQWYREGKYVPYSLEEMTQVLIDFKMAVPCWIRLNRVVRDIPDTYQQSVFVQEESHVPTNWRNTLQEEMKRRGVKCQCIRCRECAGQAFDASLATLRVVEYPASQGTEFFLSFETQEYIFAFCRLRVNDQDVVSEVFPELQDCALVRELHVYGLLVPVNGSGRKKAAASTTAHHQQTQHVGFGKQLLLACEHLLQKRFPDRCKRMCVISGVGVREFYQAQGWSPLKGEGNFLFKDIAIPPKVSWYDYVHHVIFLALLVGMLIWGAARQQEFDVESLIFSANALLLQ